MDNIAVRFGKWLRLAATEVLPDVFALNVIPTSESGESASVQYPLPAGGSSVYCSDVDAEASVTTDWEDLDGAGDEPSCILFNSLSSRLRNSTTDNPKSITIYFHRTVYATNLGLGCSGGGNFSNVKIVLLGSGGASRTIKDESTDNTKRTSRLYTFYKQLFNAIRLEFHTADTVTVSNVTIQKILGVSVSQVEPTTDSLKTISYSQAKLHLGDHFYFRDHYTVIKGGALRVLVVTPDTDHLAHMTIGLNATNSAIVAELFENPITSNDGALAVPRNRNRNYTDNNTTLLYDAPTVTNPGSLVVSGYAGAGRNVGGGVRDTEEIILKRNTKYLIRVTEQDVVATPVNINLDWYEHTNITE